MFTDPANIWYATIKISLLKWLTTKAGRVW